MAIEVNAACFPRHKVRMLQDYVKAWSMERSQSNKEDLVATWPPISTSLIHQGMYIENSPSLRKKML